MLNILYMKVLILEAKKYWKYQLTVAALMGFFMAIGFINDFPILLSSALIIGTALSVILRVNVKEPLYDERTQTVSTKSSAATLWTFVIGATVTSSLLIYLGSTTIPEYLPWGYGLIIVVITILILRLGFWTYYSRKYGG